MFENKLTNLHPAYLEEDSHFSIMLFQVPVWVKKTKTTRVKMTYTLPRQEMGWYVWTSAVHVHVFSLSSVYKNSLSWCLIGKYHSYTYCLMSQKSLLQMLKQRFNHSIWLVSSNPKFSSSVLQGILQFCHLWKQTADIEMQTRMSDTKTCQYAFRIRKKSRVSDAHAGQKRVKE